MERGQIAFWVGNEHMTDEPNKADKPDGRAKKPKTPGDAVLKSLG